MPASADQPKTPKTTQTPKTAKAAKTTQSPQTTKSATRATYPLESAQSTAEEILAAVVAADADAAGRKAIRENAKRVLRESGAADILQTLNRQALQGRGWFEEYDSGVIFKWGTSFTRRHIWVDVSGDQLRFRLNPHIRCQEPIPACDGEYHIFTAETWTLPGVVLREVDRNYKKPVAETSAD